MYCEEYSDPLSAIDREKRIKGYSRKNKNKLILTEKDDPEWKDIYPSLL